MSFAQALPDAITFSAASATGTLTDSTFYAKNLSLRTTDPDSKMQIDANSCSFGAAVDALTTYDFRLKTGGKTNADATKNYLTLTASEAGQLVIAVRTGSNSDATRTLIIKQGETELYNQAISEDALKQTEGEVNFYHYVSVNVAAGAITLTYPINGLNFYSFELKATAAPALKTVITAEKLWNHPIASMTAVAEARQGSGYNGTVYVSDKASHAVLAYSKVGDAVQQDTVVVDPAIMSTGIAVDDAGNIVLSAPEATDAFYAAPTHLLVVNKEAKTVETFDITALGRTDFISATGNIKGAEGGYVYLYGNSAKALAVHFVNGAIESSATIENIATAATGGQVVYVGTPDSYIAQVRAQALQFNGRESVSLPNIFNSKLGLDVFTIAGKEIYAYNIGNAYNSLFQLYNATDDTLIPDMDGQTQLFGVDASKTQSTSCANWLRATVIDANTAYIHQYCGSDGAALWKVSASIAAEVSLSCDEAMGSVEGAGDVAVGANATVKATPKPGYEFVAWKRGENIVSNDATYTFAVNENTALVAVFEAKENVTLTLAVNDANIGSITLPEGIIMGENSVVYGTPVALTAVPAEGATFTGWFNGEALYSTEYTLNLNSKESLSLTAKFVNVLTMAYELNGGVTNAHGWLSKAHMALDLQNDYNTAYSASKAWAKEENGVIYYYVKGEWQLPEAVQGEAADVAGFIQAVTYNTSNNLVNLLHQEKWLVLMNYIDTLRVRNGNAVADEGALRADISGFFLCSPAITDYRHTNDYTIAGTVEPFMAATKMAFANPTEIVTEVALNDPYKEGFTFDGWYATADFSGERVLTVGPETVIPGNTLYAKWIEYIPTIEEVVAMADSTTTKIRGTVTKVIGTNFWVQDATGGILCYQKNHGLAAGESVTLSGKKVMYGGIPELMNITVESHVAGQAVAPLNLQIADVIANYDKYMSQLVIFKGVILHYEGDSVFLKNGSDAIYCYKVSLDKTAMPENTKVNALVIVSAYNGKLQLRANNTGDITEVDAAGKDPYNYPARGEEGEYTLTNDWLISLKLENYAENTPGLASFVRSMVEKDGKMYFLNRDADGNGWFTVVDGATGKMSPERINITGEHLFKKEINAGTDSANWVIATTNPFNHVTMDNAGNVLVGACPIGAADAEEPNRVMIYVVDLTTGAATELINENIHAQADYLSVPFRFDAFGVWGDVNSHAVLMAANANYMDAFRWEINDGVADVAEEVEISVPEDEKSYLAGKTSFGISPVIQPVDDEYFYIDGQACYPTMFNTDGDLIDDFMMNESGSILKVGNNSGDTCTLQVNNNGYAEFQLGDEHFLLIAATCYTGTPGNAYALYKFGPDMSFADMEPLWFFPNAGLGLVAGSSYQATPSVEVSGNVAKIYIFQPNDGYGVYTFTGKVGSDDAVDNIEADVKAQKIVENGQVYILRGGVRYTVTGVQVK